MCVVINRLKSDCQNCFALCCVALPYEKSADFPLNKNAGDACPNLCSNNLCSIHDQLRDRGFRGCVTYECFGAGQHVSQVIYKGNDWRDDTTRAEEMFAVFPIVQQLHEMLWYLEQAITLTETEPFKESLREVYEQTVELTKEQPEDILNIDINSHRSTVNSLLIKTSQVYRAEFTNQVKINEQDYLGANLKGLNLQGQDFRGTLMMASDLSHSDLSKSDFIGADLRDAKLYGAKIGDALFLTQSQINSAIGDQSTEIPSYLKRPRHWL